MKVSCCNKGWLQRHFFFFFSWRSIQQVGRRVGNDSGYIHIKHFCSLSSGDFVEATVYGLLRAFFHQVLRKAKFQLPLRVPRAWICQLLYFHNSLRISFNIKCKGLMSNDSFFQLGSTSFHVLEKFKMKREQSFPLDSRSSWKCDSPLV